MNPPAITSVRTPESAPLGLDPKPLFDHGLRQVRGYAGGVWTDHNTHDPGITMLEVLCYALTDLCYRTSFPVEDLLAAREDNRKNMESQFFRPRQVLPNGPLTELDYRKLLIDVEGVRNAWVEPVEPTYYAVKDKLSKNDPGPPARPVRLRGLYRALIEYQGEAPTPAEQARIRASARAALQARRNLCEDFVDVEPVETQPFLLCGEIEIEPQADAAEAYARILLAVQRHLAPGVRRYSRTHMLRGARPDGTPRTDPDIFEGPALDHGFIEDWELASAELRTTIRLSDLISLVMDIEIVRAVRELVIRPADPAVAAAAENEGKWEVSVLPGRRCVLDPEGSRLVLYKGSMPLARSADAVARYRGLKAEDESGFRSRPMDNPDDDPEIPLGKFRDTAVYETVQTHFPAVYGIGDAGPPAGASPERKAQARRLEAYLLFFDQVLANSFAQLAEVRQLFSRDPGVEHTYFHQMVRVQDDLYKANAGRIELETADAALRRRNRFLDHLIARFAEGLHEDLEIQAAMLDTTRAAVARAKCAFLGDYDRLGAERGLAYDYTASSAAGAVAGNVSGLERRLAHRLGLGAITYEIYQERDTDAIDEFRFRVRLRFSADIVLSSPLERRYATPEAALDELGRALEAAQRPSAYRRRQDKSGRFYFEVADGSGRVLAWRDHFYRAAAARDAAIDDVQAKIAEHRGERLCVIENILLRPRPGAAATFLPICADPGCSEGCPGDDPYSYRLHVVLPARAKRFLDMNFRTYAEGVIREETPAHLLPKICWVGDDDMNKVETAWRAWRAVLDGTDTSDAAGKLATLSDALFEAKNVYTAPTLAGCEAENKFILGQNALGSEPPAPA